MDIEQYKTILDLTTEGFWYLDLTADRAYLSPRYCELIGYSPDSTVFNSSFLKSIIHPDDRDAVLRVSDELVQGTRDRALIEYRIIARDGSLLWIEGRGKIIAYGERGEPSRLAGTIIDITARKHAEDELRLFKMSVDNSSDAIGMSTSDGRHFYQNEAFDRLLGEIGDEPGSAYVDKDVFHDIFATIMGGGAWAGEVRMYGKDRMVVDILLRAYANKNEDGALAGLVGIHTDITERKKAEADVRQSERKFATIFHNSPDAIVISRLDDHVILDINESFTDILGYTKADAVGVPSTTLGMWFDPGDRATIVRHLNLEGKITNLESRLRCKGGGSILTILSSGLVEIGGVRCSLSIIHDITMRKQREDEKIALERQLLQTQKLESLGVMAGGIAHDYNNLLQAMMGSMEIALKTLPPDSGAQKLVASALRSSKRAAHLTGLLLNYVGSGSISKKALNLSDLVRENEELLRSCASKSVPVRLSLMADPPLIMADEAQIQQVVMNLITNAAEAIEEQPGLVRLATGSVICDQAALAASMLKEKPEPGPFVYLEVSDNGCGMSKKTLSRMFDPFFTTKFAGRGLGMSAVMGIIRSHNGAIFVQSQPGFGTIFRVLFPASAAVPPAAAQGPAIPQPAPADLPETTLSGLALVVDDEKPVLRICSKMVTLCGLRVLAASSGAAAVSTFREHADEIAVVLVDLTMPNMDGIATMNEIVHIRPDAKVILTSGFTEEELDKRFTGTGQAPAGFIRKPYTLDLLETELRRVMQQG